MKTNYQPRCFYCIFILLLIYCIAPSKAQNNRQWATYYGGSANEFGNEVAADAAGTVYIIGETHSGYGITTGAHGSYQSSPAGGAEAFLVKFNAAGDRLWATPKP